MERMWSGGVGGGSQLLSVVAWLRVAVFRAALAVATRIFKNA